MPDISKINALAIGSVSKVDGLAKASILDIDGVAVPIPVSTPAAAYSVRLLGSAVGVSSYTGDCMRVRRASDNVEADIAFDAGELKLTSGVSNTSDGLSYTDFADFVDHTGTPTNAFCRTWYDQSGNANDAGTSTAPNQPQIYDATTGLITKNGKPALQYASNYTQSLTLGTQISNVYSTFDVRETPSSGVAAANFLYGASSTIDYHSYSSSNLPIYLWSLAASASVYNGDTRENATTRDFTTYQYPISTQVQLTMINTGTSTIGRLSQDRSYTNRSWSAKWQECIIYSQAMTTERDAIELNINGFFSIYP